MIQSTHSTALRCFSILLLAMIVRPLAAHEGHEAATKMADAATQFIASLTDQQKAETIYAWDSEQREGWHFFPDKFIPETKRRFGLAIRDMTSHQRLLAQGLLATGLSSNGYRQTLTVMTLEAILHELENQNPIRDPELYYVTIFGEPGRIRRGRGDLRDIIYR